MLEQRALAHCAAREAELRPYLGQYNSFSLKEKFTSYEELMTLEVCEKREKRFQLGVPLDSYLERIVQDEKGREVMMGIRFRNLNTDRPFVFAWPSFKVEEEDIFLLKEMARREFQEFSPLYLSLPMAPDYKSKIHKYSYDMVTVLGHFKHWEPFKLDEGLEIRKLENLNFYPEYQREYDLFHKSVPALSGEVEIEDEETLQEAMKLNLAYSFHVKDDFAGIILATEREYAGVPGIAYSEKFLYSRFRGKGYSVPMQKAFLNEISKRDYEVYWGTILYANKPSLRSALSTKRQICEMDIFFDL